MQGLIGRTLTLKDSNDVYEVMKVAWQEEADYNKTVKFWLLLMSKDGELLAVEHYEVDTVF